MKKSLLVLGILAGVAHADTTTLYGRVGYAVTVDDATKVDSKTALNLQAKNIRLGVKGDEELNNGLSAFYNLEFQYDFKDNNGALSEIRQANMGLKGSFGRIAFGKMTTIRGSWLAKADIFNSLSGAGWDKTRLGKVVSYVSPSISGVTLGASVVLDGRDNSNDPNVKSDIIKGERRNVNAGEVGAKFSMNGFDVAAVYTRASENALQASLGRKLEIKDATTGDKVTVHDALTSEEIAASIGHSNDVYKVGFDYAHRASQGNYYALGAEYYLGPTNTFRFGLEAFDPAGNSKEAKENDNNQYRIALGYQYNFSKRTFAWVEGAYTRDDGAYDVKKSTKAQKAVMSKESGYSAVVGIRHNF